jgi:predicted nucleic acid-binding Zn finger protein
MRHTAAMLAIVGTPALADLPPYCEMDANNTALSVYDGYTPFTAGDGLVTLTVHGGNPDDYVIVLQHCASGTQLLAVVANGQNDEAARNAVAGRFDEMMTSTTSYSMQDVRDELNDLGARASVAQIAGQSCGCATYNFARE